MRVTALLSPGAREVHLGLDVGHEGTRPLCPATGAGMRTTAIEAATCRPCVAAALARGLDIAGLVLIPERLRRRMQALRAASAEFESVSDVELMLLLDK